MEYSTEVFVMIIFIIGVPLFAGVIRSANLPGSGAFILAYIFLMLSNIFTVIEKNWFEDFFNLLEHASITISSILIYIAVRKLIADREQKNRPSGFKGAQQ